MMTSYSYSGNQTGNIPGNLPPPYYWWEVGAMFGSLIDYYQYTNDGTYNDVVTQGMLFQAGPSNDYMTPNQTTTEGNDDQGFWGMAAMSAAEQKFPDPPTGKPGWLALAQAVFNTQAGRWDPNCGGGLRWQIFTFNNGYDYKNSISNGIFFNLGARLAVYTKNDTYAQWAEKTFDWNSAVGLTDSSYHFFDGAHIEKNCTDISKVQWTYSAGAFLLGAANMYNYVCLASNPRLMSTTDCLQTNGSSLWKDRVLGIINGSNVFFTGTNNSIMYEVACEPYNNCNTDSLSYKAYLSRWMAHSIKYAPFIHDLVIPKLRTSAIAAAQQCSGGSNGQMCGLKWTEGAKWDGTQGVGQQMSALEVIQSNLIEQTTGPVTGTTGGTSQGNPSAGGSGSASTDPSEPASPIGTKDRAGAGLLSAVVGISLIGTVSWICVE